MTDTLLLLGNNDPKLERFLGKMGYQIRVGSGGTPLSESVGANLFDMVVLDSRIDIDPIELCEFLRNNDQTKKVPIVVLSSSPAVSKIIKSKGYDRLEIVDQPYTIGSLASRIATQLRMRKMVGASGDPRVGLAEANAALRDLTQRFQKELEDARRIQQALLPAALPSDDRYDIAAHYSPLDQVGGDWYFVQAMDAGRVLCQVADVTGHGLAAAFIGSMTKLALFAAPQDEPGALLTEMNRLMGGHIPSGRFVTMGCLDYDPATGAARWARAGHPPAILFRSLEQRAEELKGDGFAVGFFDDSQYQSQAVQLEIGDVVVLYTDGITEAQNRNRDMYGTERLVDSLKGCPADSSASQIVTKVMADFEAFRDGRLLKDDLTVLVLKRRA